MEKKYNINLSRKVESCSTMSEVLSNTALQMPNNIFLIYNNKKITYTKFNDLVNSCCDFFDEEKIIEGDLISIVLRNSVDYLVIYLACLRSGVVVNPFPFYVSANEIKSKIEIVRPKAVFSHTSHYKPLSESEYKVFDLDNMDGMPFIEYLERYIVKPNHRIKVQRNKTAALYYSSGTTGVPKIIEYPHRAMISNQGSMLRAGCAEPNAVHICILPLGHTAALNNSIFHCICTGSTVVLFESFWKIRANIWDLIQEYKCTYMVVVPTILISILNTPYKDFTPKKVKSMKFIGCGSAFLAKNIQDKFENLFGIPVSNLYGSSETGATHFDNPFTKGRKTGNIGKPLDTVDVKIFDNKNREVKDGELGVFGIKSPALLKSYFKNEEDYKNCFHKEYFITGDIGYRDSNGLYYYVDRKKDLIIKGGVNILPSQIDEVLQSHPQIEEVATISKPDMILGENIKCYIVLKTKKTLDSKKLKSYCKEYLGDFKTPSEFEFVTSLPKGPSGKILKRELREREHQASIS